MALSSAISDSSFLISRSIFNNDNLKSTTTTTTTSKTKLSKRQLVRQRQALRRKSLPKSKKSSRDDLKAGIGKLTKLPSNRSLSEMVKVEELQIGKSKLKKSKTSDTGK